MIAWGGAGSYGQGLLWTQAQVTLLSSSDRPAFLLILLQHRPGTSPILATREVGTKLPSIVGRSKGKQGVEQQPKRDGVYPHGRQ